jgi:hypothetical protein
MSQILLYQSEDGRTKLDVRLENQTLWLNQKQLTEFFGKAKGTISEHIKHIFEDGELEEISVVRLFRTTATDSNIYEVSHYNLDMVLALGFGVRSPMAVRFRQWAADKLKEYITKTYDNGKEFAHHKLVAEILEAEAYFAHPYHSWERGLNENTNGLIRQKL